ncbi:MAG: type IV conjugative transfer system protein TraE [Rhizobacter sp.]
MNPTAVSTDLKQLRATVVMQRYSIFGLVGAVVLSLIIVYNLTGRQQTVLVPPVIEKSFWVSHDKVSSSYLEQMAAFMSYLLLDVAPSSIEWKKNLLLQYVMPSNLAEYETRQKLESDRLKTLNASTQFSITGLKPNERDMTVAVSGRLATYINGTRTSEDAKTFLAKFVYTNGRIHLNKFEEVVPK